MADGLHYLDTRAPFISADQATVTLSTTAKALYTASAFPVLGGQYFDVVGKKLMIRCFGKITTDGTAGNGNFAIYYGTGADANGVLLQSSTAVALTTSQTTLSWECTVYVSCRSTGSAGTLFCDGVAVFNEAVLAARQFIPAGTAVVSGACDLTAANIISVQYLRSGTGVYTMAVQDMEVTALGPGS